MFNIVLAFSFGITANATERRLQTIYMGKYSDITHSAESDDCDGFALQLWSWITDTGEVKIVGSWTADSGPCDDTVPQFDADFNSETGTISFSTMAISGRPGKFRGVIRRDFLEGDFNWGGGNSDAQDVVHIRLPRKPVTTNNKN
jgi:hypothetical protein